MIKLKCESCANTSFYEDADRYVCEYCNSSIIKPTKPAVNHNTYIYHYSKYKYTLMVAIVFIVYLLADSIVGTKDTPKEVVINHTRDKVKPVYAKRSTAYHSNKYSVLSTGESMREYQHISYDKNGNMNLCVKKDDALFTSTVDVYLNSSRHARVSTCSVNKLSKLLLDDGYIEAKEIVVNNQKDIELTKYDKNHKKIWQRVVGSVKNDTLTHILKGPNGFFILGGKTKGNKQYAKWLLQIKTDIPMADFTRLTEPRDYWQEL